MPYNYKCDHEKVIKDYQSGLSLREVGKLNNVHFERVRQILNKNGIPLRPRYVTKHAKNYTGLKEQNHE